MVLRSLLLLVICLPSGAKCPTAVLTVSGDVQESASEAVTIVVTVETPKGTFTESAAVTQPSFKIAVPFPTFTSYSPLLGHRCNNRPKTVVITEFLNGKQLDQKKLTFEDHGTTLGLYEYGLRNNVTVDTSGIRVEAPSMPHH
jgi:hypothetical protein